MFIKIRAHKGEFLNESEPIGASFSMKRQTDGQTKVERPSTMYEVMVLAHILPSRGLRRESNTDALIVGALVTWAIYTQRQLLL